MATKRTAKLPYRWANGSYHSRPETKHGAAPVTTYKPDSTPKPSKVGVALRPGTPGAAAPVQPLDPAVVNAQVVANRNVGVNDLYSTWQQGNLDQQYGFGASGAANPYSDAAKLQENFKRSVLGTTNNYAAQGQLYSGAKDRAQNENQRTYDMGYDALRRAYDQASGNIQFGRLQTYADAGTGVDSEKFNAMLRALGGL